MPFPTRLIAAIALPMALATLGGCAQPFQANVARFQALPVPEGQSFAIVPVDPRHEGGLEFRQYAEDVKARLAAYGYRPVDGGAKPALLVKFDYGVDKGVQKTVSRPSAGFGSWGGYGGGFGGGYGGFGPYGRRWGYGSAFFYGWDPYGYDPFFDQRIDTYTVYTSYVDMTIERSSDGQHVFEGKAKARSLNDTLTTLVPKLTEAMFTNFPGQSGEEVKITIAPEKK